MNQEAMDALRAADPATRARLDAVDPGALDALRRGIVMSEQNEPGTKRARRRVLPGMIAGVVGLVLAGGGVAYASGMLGFIGGLADGPNCLTEWGQAAEASGPWLTGDAIADCHTIRTEAGLPPIEDPAVFGFSGFTYVVPESEVPPAVEFLAPSRVMTPAVLELELSLGDWVDGGQSVDCPTMAESVDGVEADLARLGLTDWTVTTRDPGPEDGPCTWPFVAEKGEVMVVHDPAADSGDQPEADVPAPTPSTSSEPVRDVPTDPAAGPRAVAAALRQGITERCISLDEARALVDETLAERLDHEPVPTTSIVDESVDCARVDLRVGGNVQVTVYGPTSAG
jgi:hypothetical protein